MLFKICVTNEENVPTVLGIYCPETLVPGVVQLSGAPSYSPATRSDRPAVSNLPGEVLNYTRPT